MNKRAGTAVAVISALVALAIVLVDGPLVAAVIVALVGGLTGVFIARTRKGGSESTGIRVER